MDIGLIFDNIVGLAGVFLEMMVAAITFLFRLAILLAVVTPIFLGLKIRRQQGQAKVSGKEASRDQNKAARAEKNQPPRGTKPHHAPPATLPDGPVMGGGVVNAGPGGILEDPEAWILRQYPAKGGVAVKTLALLGMIVAGLGAGLMGLLRLWAAAAPDPEEGHTLWDFNPHMSTYSDDSMPWTSSSQIVDSLDRETR